MGANLFIFMQTLTIFGCQPKVGNYPLERIQESGDRIQFLTDFWLLYSFSAGLPRLKLHALFLEMRLEVSAYLFPSWDELGVGLSR